ncbi:bifunctional DNA primase/polymerase [Sphingomonas olei]
MNNSENSLGMQGAVVDASSIALLEAALDYAAKGWPVFPCRARDSEAGKAKSPYVSGGFKSASCDPAVIRAWWAQWPDAMIAAPTGAAIGAWVLDIDDEPAFAAVERELGLPATRASRTSKGRHLFFAWDDTDPVRNSQKCADLPGADVRGEGGYVILPPSLHPSGAAYTWIRDEDASEPPAALMAILPTKSGKRTSEANDTRYAVCTAAYNAIAVEELGLPEWVNSEAARLAMVVTPKGARSEAVNGFVAQAIREGWTDAEIGGVLIHPDNAISERVRELSDPKREIDRAIAHYRTDERVADGELPHIRNYPRIDWDKFLANCLAKQQGKAPLHANDNRIGIVATKGITARELLLLDFPPVKWIVPNIIPEGLTVLAGAPKVGKSWLALDIATAVAEGAPALGGIQCEQGRSLYLALEDNQRRLADRLRMMGYQHGSDNLVLMTEWPSIDEGCVDELERWADANPDARLVTIDVFAKVKSSTGGNKPQYEIDYKEVSTLQRFAIERSLGVILVHHTRKMDSDDPFDAVSGTRGITGSADSTLVLSKGFGGHQPGLYGRGRDVEEFEKQLIFDACKCRWLICGNIIAPVASPEQRQILEAMRAASEPMALSEIAEAVGKSASNVTQMLSKLEIAGRVIKPAYGRYAIAQ